MKVASSELSRAIQTALSMGAVAAVGVAGTAVAQSTNTGEGSGTPTTLQTVVVTGSHIRRVDLETSNPVVAVTTQQIEATGQLTLGDVVQQLPVITGGRSNPTVNNGGGGSGATRVGLRGLGASRTLMLVDGHRIISNDLNAIPTAAVQRIEVLTDGASAVYGSDAVGGVINIILKSNYQGAQFTMNYGISDHSDGARRGASFVFGQATDKGSLLAGVSYNKFDSILQSARKFSKDSLSLVDTDGGGVKAVVGGSTFAARDYISVSQELASQFGCTSGKVLSLNESAWVPGNTPTKAGDYHCYQQTDGYNYAAINFLMTPHERVNGFFKGVYHLTDNVDFYGAVTHSHTGGGSQLAPAVFGTPTVGGLTISKDSYYNPFGVDFSAKSGGLYRARLYPGAPRSSKNSISNDQVTAGFRGHFMVLDRDWTWDVGYDYGHLSTISTALGYPNQKQIVPGLGPSMMDPATNTVVCVSNPGDLSSVIAGCTPWDPFNLNSPSAAQVIGSASSPAMRNTWEIERTYHAGASGGLFDLPAGTMQIAGGVSYRKEYTSNTISPVLLLNPATGTCTLGSGCGAHLQGGYTVKEAYAELFVPVLRDLPFASSLNVTLGDRYSKYSTFGSTNNWKVGVEWRPIDDLLLRGTVSSVFRAPTIENVFASPTSNAPLLGSDPCDHITTPGNPACVGVPTDGTFVNQQVLNHQQIQGLNTGAAYSGIAIGPEQGKSFDFGIVYSPHFVPGLSLSADLWRIYLVDTIGRVGVQTVMDLCFNGIDKYCPFIDRIQGGPNAGQILRMTAPIANLGRIDLNGVDFSGQYRLPQLSFGQFTLGVQGTYLTTYTIQTAPGQAGNDVINAAGVMGGTGTALQSSCPFSSGAICFFPRIRARGTARWQLGPWDAQWTMDYNSSFKMYGTAGDTQGIDHWGAYVYNNVTVGYNIAPINTRINIGVDNVMDKKPPILFANHSQNANTDPNDFDTIGRYYWARLTVQF